VGSRRRNQESEVRQRREQIHQLEPAIHQFEPAIHEFTNSPLHQLLGALESRHLANFTRSEVARALRALSSCYVERRTKLASGAPLETAGTRAAYALYYGPLHFVTTSQIVRASGLPSRGIGAIHDLGCGTGVAGAAWALDCSPLPAIDGIDRSAWAVDEANWLYRHLNVRGRATRGDLLRGIRPRRGSFGPSDALLFAYSLNELPPPARAQALNGVIDAVRCRASLLVIEPIGKRLGNAGWWDEWCAALKPHAVVEDEWRFPSTLLPQPTRDLAHAAGLDPRELTARTLATR
jgi:hypothetical protein